MEHEVFSLTRADGPLLISIPHLGVRIPESLRQRYTDTALSVEDTDWHLDRLYGFAHELGATFIGAKLSRYVIDLNRPPNDESLYPGQTTTGLCPTETFRGDPIYRPGCAPDAQEKARRVEAYWQPYHAALQSELQRLRALHPHVLLWEAHSIASVLPRLFEGKLPDLNFGTQDGKTAAASIQSAITDAAAATDYTWVANGRFKGGYITRHFGKPADGIHALQLEMCQSTYMHETSPFDYAGERAQRVAPTLRKLLDAAMGALHSL